MFFLLFGSSASGKTTVIHDVVGLVPGIEVHDFDEIDVPPGADTAWRQRAYGYWIDRAFALQSGGTDLVLCGQTPLGELLASPSAPKLEAISACLVDCDDVTRGLRLDGRGEEWFARSAGHLQKDYTWPEWVQNHLMWADWLRRHAKDPQWMPHVIQIPETATEMRWERWADWQAGDPRWAVHTIDTSERSRFEAAQDLARWIEGERRFLAAGEHPLVNWAYV